MEFTICLLSGDYIYEEFRPGRKSRIITDDYGGAFIDHALYLLGRLEEYFDGSVTRIYAEMGKFRFKDLEVEDHGIALARFGPDGMATIESTFTSPVQTHDRMHIIGTEGEMEISGNMIKISSKGEDAITNIELVPPNASRDRTFLDIPVSKPPADGSSLLNEFIECILEDKDPVGTGEMARRHLDICLAAYKSVEIGAPVDLPYKGEDIDVAGIMKKL